MLHSIKSVKHICGGGRSEVHVYFPSQKLLTHACTDKYAENSVSLWAESLFRGATGPLVIQAKWFCQGLGFRVCFLTSSAAHTGHAEDEDAVNLNFQSCRNKQNLAKAQQKLVKATKPNQEYETGYKPTVQILYVSSANWILHMNECAHALAWEVYVSS